EAAIDFSGVYHTVKNCVNHGYRPLGPFQGWKRSRTPEDASRDAPRGIISSMTPATHGIAEAETEAKGAASPKLSPARVPLNRDLAEPAGSEFWLLARAVSRLAGAAGGVALVTAVLRASEPRWQLANLSLL